MKMKHVLMAISVSLVGLLGCTTEGEFVKPEAIHWDYEHSQWQEEGFGDCAGSVQSPINVDTSKTIKAKLSDISFNYTDFAMKIIDNGHSIEISGGEKSSISLNGVDFTFKQFHFHRHSEHHINGKSGEMELHLVHVDYITGNATVLGIMLEQGAENEFVKKIWANIPNTKKQEVTTTETINLMDILPTDKRYYTYTGSLTTPPCSQGLQWILFKEPMKVSKEQIEKFEAIYEDNARPIQPTNNRPILEKL